jgi:hypothetical protein
MREKSVSIILKPAPFNSSIAINQSNIILKPAPFNSSIAINQSNIDTGTRSGKWP